MPDQARSTSPVRLCYVAYPTSLTLRAANAIQTFLTVRELRALRPGLLMIVPRLLREPSSFEQVGAVHLPRIPIGKASRFFPGTGWYYLERSAFAWLVALSLLFRRLFRRQRYDVIYVREVICAYWLTAWLHWMTGARVVYEAHELESRNPSRAKGRLWQPILRYIDRTLMRRATGVVSLTSTFAQELEELGWRKTSDTAVLPDAYDDSIYRPLPKGASRQALGLGAQEQVLIYSGLTFSYRGLERLLEAVAQLVPRFPALRLYLVGGRAAEVEKLRGQARSLGLIERVSFVGAVGREQVPQYLAAADVLVIPGTVSGASASPLKMFEYMAMDRPIVSVDIPALREVLDDRSAYLFPPDDTAALARQIEEALSHPEEAREKAARALQDVAAYTYRHRAEMLLEIVDKQPRMR